MECFCWKDVPIEDVIKIKGREVFEEDRDIEEACEKEGCKERGAVYDPQTVANQMRTLYPDEVIGEVGSRKRDGKRFKFTIIVEEIEDEDYNVGERC